MDVGIKEIISTTDKKIVGLGSDKNLIQVGLYESHDNKTAKLIKKENGNETLLIEDDTEIVLSVFHKIKQTINTPEKRGFTFKEKIVAGVTAASIIAVFFYFGYPYLKEIAQEKSVAEQQTSETQETRLGTSQDTPPTRIEGSSPQDLMAPPDPVTPRTVLSGESNNAEASPSQIRLPSNLDERAQATREGMEEVMKGLNKWKTRAINSRVRG